MNYQIISYLLYLGLSLAITVWVGKILFANGRHFLLEVFKNVNIADSMNRLLITGFYLVNIGYAAVTVQMGYSVNSMTELIEILSAKVGIVILILGALHFANIFIFYKMRKQTKEQDAAQEKPIPQGGITH